jgi:hypothetical protein
MKMLIPVYFCFVTRGAQDDLHVYTHTTQLWVRKTRKRLIIPKMLFVSLENC